MAITTEKTNGADIQGQWSTQRRGAGFILAIFSFLFLLGTGAARRAQAQTFIVLHNFAGSPNDGAGPDSTLVRDSSGNLYGTTNYGGTSNNCPFSVPGLPDSCGTVFELDTSGTLTVLHNFTGGTTDGAKPVAGLVRDASGNLYGTTLEGGASASCSSGCGTVFKLDPSNTLTVLHNFAGSPSDGASPFAGLVRDSSGNLYGTTVGGGSSYDGTVFKLDTSNTLTPLHIFAGSPGDGSHPQSTLVRDASGNLYGTTSNGGTSTNCSTGCGTVFKVDPSGTPTVLHNFSGSDGANPFAALVMDSSGNLYGTTFHGGTSTNCSNGCGTIFKLDTSGALPVLTVLHNFSGTDGANPYAGLVMDPAGNLYGTTGNGGNSSECTVNDGCGTIFKLDTSGALPVLTVLHRFSGSDGVYPFRRLVMDSSGNLYGTTFNGGTSINCPGSPTFGPAGCGTVFELILSNTPTGSNVSVTPTDTATSTSPVSLTFSSITQAGTTTLTTSGSAPAVPQGFHLGSPATYYNLTTTATYSGPITICINYSGVSFQNQSQLSIWHYDTTALAWTQLTTTVDTTTTTACAVTPSLSPFALLEPAYAAQVQSPINADGTSVFNTKRGIVPVKFTLTYGGISTCQLPAATISLIRIGGSSLGSVDQTDYQMAADSGSNFRIDTSSCQYVYNLDSSSLGAGTYQVNISIDDTVVGSGRFGLQ